MAAHLLERTNRRKWIDSSNNRKHMQQHMQRVLGVICLISGVILLLRGHEMAESFGSHVQQVFTGAPTNRSTYFYIGGVALTIFGASQIFWPARPK